MAEVKRSPTPPEWLNNSFLETALKEGMKNDDLEILDFDIKIATAAGDNYSSLLFRINLNVKTGNADSEKLSLVVKVLPHGIIAEELQKFSIFKKEAECLSKILPKIDATLMKVYPDHENVGPVCYYHHGPPNDVLIMEDLRVGGFILGNRFEGLDMDHSILVLKSLGRFHAASLIVKDQNPKILESYDSNVWTQEPTEPLKNFLTSPFKILSKDILTWSDFDKKEIYAEKLKRIEETIVEKVSQAWAKDDKKVNVIIHGDSWVNNFMFRYDPSGKLTGIKIVDFQLTNINNPAIELQYFIFTSVKPELRYDNIDFFLKTYYEAFEETLNRLEYHTETPFDLNILKKEFEEKYFWGFVVFCALYPVLIIPSGEVCDTDEFFKEEKGSKFENIYQRESFIKLLKEGFVFFEGKGVF